MKGQPFYFDENHFDDDLSLKMRDANPQLELKYTDDDLEIAKNTSYAKGKKDGIAETKNSLENKTLNMVENLLREVAVLQGAETERNKRYEAEALHLTTHILKKIFPLLFEREGFEELKALISETLSSIPKNTEIEVLIHQDTAPLMQEHLQKVSTVSAKKIKIIPSDAINITSCQLSWPDGGAILAPQNTADQILNILRETLASENIVVTGSEDDAHMIPSDNGEALGEKDE